MNSQWERDWESRNKIRADKEKLEATMREVTLCCRDLIRPPAGGPGLGEILIGYQFKEILEEEGLALVPCKPTPGMQVAWQQGWFRRFSARYNAMLHAAWGDDLEAAQ
jgi:hypothetical protein